MQDVLEAIARQLDAAGRRARRLLVLRRVFQFVAVAAPACVGLGLVDWLLRLPGWLRLIVMAGLLATAAVWLWGRLRGALRFGPGRAELALRAERLFPDLRGWLASGLELSGAAGAEGTEIGDSLAAARTAERDQDTNDALVQATVREAERRATGRVFGQLVDPRAARKSAAWALVGVVVLLGAVAASPGSAKTAAERWLLPLGDAAWPKRVQVEAVGWPSVLAADTPARLDAAVTRGATDDLRVWAVYRFEHDARGLVTGSRWSGPTQRVLMNRAARTSPTNQAEQHNEADAPRFSVQVDPPAELARRLRGSDEPARLVVTLEAGDDATDPAEIPVVLRPGLASATATIVPPDYARAHVPDQRLELPANAERLGTITALQGSQLELTLCLTTPGLLGDPEAPNAQSAASWFTGLAPDAQLEAGPDGGTVTIRQRLDEPATLGLLIADARGLTDTATRRLRLLITPDAPPTVGILEPATDQSVLPTAVLPVRVQASDDVALRDLRVAVNVPLRETQDDAADAPEPDGDEPGEASTTRAVPLADVAGPRLELAAELTLSLGDFDLRPGDVAVLDASALDVFDVSAGDRAPAVAVPRRLRIIDAATLLSEVQRELASVRRTAERLRVEQSGLRRAQPDSPGDLAVPQERLTRGIAPAESRLDATRERLALNRLAEPELDELIDAADRLLDEAAEASDRAAERFAEDTEDAEPAARDAQQQAEAKLTELAELLDQGGDALSLRLEIGGLRAEQEALALDTREQLPQTAGLSLDELTDEQRESVEALAERQRQLAERGEDLVLRMSSTAEALAQSSDRDADQAAAEALQEAAEVARRKGLPTQMQQAGEQAGQNRLSQAGDEQLDALDTLDRMLEQMGTQEAKRRERLQRRLRELAERIERLIADQTVLRDRVPELDEDAEPDEAQAQATTGLAEPQASLWQRVIVVQTQAERDPATEPVAPTLGEAADSAAAAVGSLRLGQATRSRARQAEAIAALERALDEVRQAQQEQRQQEAQNQRDELRRAYLELADEQDALREQAEPLAERDREGRLDRRGRAELRRLAEPQADLGVRIEALREQVAGQVVFEAMHDRANARLAEALTGLRGGLGAEAGRVPDDQSRVSATLRAMAEALVAPPGQNDFANNQPQQGGGGGGGGGGEVVPDAAQLKLLRGEQAGLLERTAIADERLGGGNEADVRSEIDALADQQRELTRLAQRLKLDMERKRRQAMPIPQPQPQPDTPEPEVPDATP